MLRQFACKHLLAASNLNCVTAKRKDRRKAKENTRKETRKGGEHNQLKLMSSFVAHLNSLPPDRFAVTHTLKRNNRAAFVFVSP